MFGNRYVHLYYVLIPWCTFVYFRFVIDSCIVTLVKASSIKAMVKYFNWLDYNTAFSILLTIPWRKRLIGILQHHFITTARGCNIHSWMLWNVERLITSVYSFLNCVALVIIFELAESGTVLLWSSDWFDKREVLAIILNMIEFWIYCGSWPWLWNMKINSDGLM